MYPIVTLVLLYWYLFQYHILHHVSRRYISTTVFIFVPVPYFAPCIPSIHYYYCIDICSSTVFCTMYPVDTLLLLYWYLFQYHIFHHVSHRYITTTVLIFVPVPYFSPCIPSIHYYYCIDICSSTIFCTMYPVDTLLLLYWYLFQYHILHHVSRRYISTTVLIFVAVPYVAPYIPSIHYYYCTDICSSAIFCTIYPVDTLVLLYWYLFQCYILHHIPYRYISTTVLIFVPIQYFTPYTLPLH